MGNIGSLYAYIGADTTGLTLAQKNVSSFVASTTRKFQAIGTVVKGASAAMAAIGAGVVFKEIIKSGIEYEKTMAVVRGVSRATADEFKQLSSITKQLGATTEWTATQAAQGLRFLSMAGFEVQDSLKAIGPMLDLATAGNIDLGRAADIATNAMTAMGIAVEDLGKVNDVFVATITRTNTDMEMMAESFKYAAPVAKAFGYTIDEVATMIGLLGNAGVQGSMAGTQLAFAIQKAAIYAKELGMQDAKLMDVLEELNKQQADQLEFMDIFDMRGGRAALILKDQVKAYGELGAKVKNSNGEAQQLATTMRDTLGNSFTLLISALDGVSKRLYEEVFRDDLKAQVDSITDSVTELTGTLVMVGKVVKFPFDLIGTMVDTLQAAFYGVVTVIASAVFLILDLIATAYEKYRDLSETGTGKHFFKWTTYDEAFLKGLNEASQKIGEIAEGAQKRTLGNISQAMGFGDITKEIEKQNKAQIEADENYRKAREKTFDFLIEKEFAEVDAEAQLLKMRNENNDTMSKELRETYKKMYEDMNYHGQEWLDNEIALYRAQAKEMIKNGVLRVDAEKWVKDQIEKLTSSEAVNRRVDKALENEFAILDDIEGKLKDNKKATEKYSQDKLQTYRAMYSDMQKYTKRYYEYENKMIDLQAEEFKKAGIEKVEIDNWVYEKKRELLKKELIDTQGFVGGMQAAVMDIQDSWTNFYKVIGQFGYDTFKGLYDAFDETLFYGLQGKFDEIGDVWENLWNNMKQTALKIVSDMIMEIAAKKIASSIGGDIGSGIASMFGSGGGGSSTSSMGSLATLGPWGIVIGAMAYGFANMYRIATEPKTYSLGGNINDIENVQSKLPLLSVLSHGTSGIGIPEFAAARDTVIDQFDSAISTALVTYSDSVTDVIKDQLGTEFYDYYFSVTDKRKNLGENVKEFTKEYYEALEDKLQEVLQSPQTQLALFTEDLQNTIDSMTLPEWQNQLKSLNNWYKIQIKTLENFRLDTEASKTALDKLNEAYQLQVSKIEESATGISTTAESYTSLVDRLTTYVESVDNFISDMTLSSEFAPSISYEQIQNKFNEMYAKALSGDQEALSSLFGYTQQTYLPFMQSYNQGGYNDFFDSLFGPSGIFSTMSEEVVNSLGSPYGLDYTELLSSMNSTIDLGSQDIVESIREQTLDLVTAIMTSSLVTTDVTEADITSVPDTYTSILAGLPNTITTSEGAVIAEFLSNLLINSGTGSYGTGGYITSPTIAQIGERGNEWVVPSYNPDRDKFLESVGVTPEVIASLITSNMGGEQKVVVKIGAKELIDIIISEGRKDQEYQKFHREINNG